jgi:hypothetical protein
MCKKTKRLKPTSSPKSEIRKTLTESKQRVSAPGEAPGTGRLATRKLEKLKTKISNLR